MSEIILRGIDVEDPDPDHETRIWDLSPEQAEFVRWVFAQEVMTGCRIEVTPGRVIRERRATIEQSLKDIATSLQGGVIFRFADESPPPSPPPGRKGRYVDVAAHWEWAEDPR